MPRSFVHLWRRREFESHRVDKASKLWSASGNTFRKRGLLVGDRIYVVSCFDEKLFLLGRIDVSHILGPAEAREYAVSERPLWNHESFNWNWASDHVFCDDSNLRPMRFDLIVPGDVTRKLQFENGGIAKFRSESNRLIPNPQTFRGFRELSWQSAADFDELIFAKIKRPKNIE